MSEAIGLQRWMTAPATRAVIAALEASGGVGCARFVGGCVRDAITGFPVEDIDIATVLEPREVMAAAAAAGLKAVPTGIDHGTVTVISASRPFEVTTLRRDVETDGRRAVVAFTTDWGEDAARRDFRLNALYADAEGILFDPTGGGVADARAGRIIFVGDAETRIREDYLRILRFFRFFAWYGRGEPDPHALAACAELKGGLGTLSAERVSKELLKLLAAEDPRRAVQLMSRTGVLAEVLPEAEPLHRFDKLVALQREVASAAPPELRLASLLPPNPQVVEARARSLRLSNAQVERLVAASQPPPLESDLAQEPGVRRVLYRLGADAFGDQILLSAAAGALPSERLPTLLRTAAQWRRPVLPVAGQDAKALGLRPGSALGQVLRDVEGWWIEQDFPDDRQAALEQLRRVARPLLNG